MARERTEGMVPVVVLSEDSPRLPPSASARSLHVMTEAARLAGCTVYPIPQEDVCPEAPDALAHVPAQPAEAPAVWLGYIPPPPWYAAIYDAAREKGICLLNDPDEHLNAQEFDRAYPRLRELTPASEIITHPTECAGTAARLGLPLFVKGTVQSRKARGWQACVAESLPEFERLTRELLELDNRSRGRVVVRQLVRLRHSRTSAQGFPFGREYRVFLYQQQVLAHGYYWDGDDPLRTLSAVEEAEVLALAQEAARRLGTPFVAVDFGQQDDGKWIVIETGDAQFSGASQTPLLPLWRAIAQIG